MKFKKNNAIVDLMGGLGNQLFQICFANYLKENGVNVYISEEWFFNNRQLKILPDRKPIFDLNHFDLKRTSRKNQLNLKFFERVSEIPIFQKQLTKKIFQQFTGHSFYINDIKKYNKFWGYWHNLKFIENQKDFIANSLIKNTLYSENLKDNIGKTLIHIRKSDYKIINEVLPKTYYLESLEIIKNSVGLNSYDIFIDEENYDYQDDIFQNASNVYCDMNEDPIITFSKMMNYSNYILANSTFSLFPAFLSENEGSKILYPQPWFVQQAYDSPVKPNWIPVKRN
jgi:hypothetical protein